MDFLLKIAEGNESVLQKVEVVEKRRQQLMTLKVLLPK
jgi:hypothetical protein